MILVRRLLVLTTLQGRYVRDSPDEHNAGRAVSAARPGNYFLPVPPASNPQKRGATDGKADEYLLDENVLFESAVPFKHGLAVSLDILLHVALHDCVCHGSRAIERAERADNHTEDHRKREAADCVAAKEEDAEKHEQGRH